MSTESPSRLLGGLIGSRFGNFLRRTLDHDEQGLEFAQKRFTKPSKYKC
jgi:hypothetical protein